MQFSFNSGEWAPALNARVDIAKYHSGAALLRNFFVDYRGGATARPGTKYILKTRLTSPVRLIPFQASLTVSYVLEFGDLYIRFFNNGAPVLETGKAITGITQANPAVVTSNAHGFVNGDWVFISNVAGMTQVNGNYYIVAGATANTYQLNNLTGFPIDSTAYATYTSGGTAQRVYTISSPYAASELSLIKYAQNVDTMILCHPNHPPYQLILVTAANWTLTPIVFGTTIATPTGLAVVSTLAAGTVHYAYIVTAVDINGQESAQSAYATIGPITDIRSVAGTITVTWGAVAGAVSYNIYRANPNYATPVPAGSAFGFIGNVVGVTMIDSNIGPDFSSGPPVIQTPFAGNNPTVPGIFQQRLVLAGPISSPQQFNFSQPGSYYNFNTSTPVEPDNAISGTLTSGQLNTIQSMSAQPQGLIVFSDKQAWLINGGSPGAPISATQIVANTQAYNGASFPPPIVANDNVLYVQSKGSIVRDLVFNFYTQVYTGTDISVLSSHLFYGFTILGWAWAEEPYKIVWAVRDDGTMLTLTFLKEQDLIAWTHSDTQGLFKSVASITETVASGQIDAVYTVVQRTIAGNIVQYVERIAELFYPNGLTDAWAVDAGLQYNGAATLAFMGAQHLAAATVTGLATDNLGNVTVITPFVMPLSGSFNLPTPASPATGYTRVTIGLAYTPQLKTLQLDTGEPTVQGKMKSIPAVTVRVNQTLGLSIGKTFDTLTPMKDLVRGNVGSATNTRVTDLVTGDAMTRLDPSWTVPGQYCIAQPLPFPASILGVIPQVAPGDTVK